MTKLPSLEAGADLRLRDFAATVFVVCFAAMVAGIFTAALAVARLLF